MYLIYVHKDAESQNGQNCAVSEYIPFLMVVVLIDDMQNLCLKIEWRSLLLMELQKTDTSLMADLYFVLPFLTQNLNSTIFLYHLLSIKPTFGLCSCCSDF